MIDQPDPATDIIRGRDLPGSIHGFIRACVVLLRDEQEKPLPDSTLTTTLCDGVRLARAYADVMTGQQPCLVTDEQPTHKRFHIVEGVESTYHYHLSLTGIGGQPSLCGNSRVMPTGLTSWCRRTHLNERYCNKCELAMEEIVTG